MVAISPYGGFMWISSPFEGAASDRKIIELSEFRRLIKRGMTVLGDRGFTIDDLLAELGAFVVIPPFLDKDGKLSDEDELKTKFIASARIHVERLIQRITIFEFCKGPVQHDKLCILKEAVHVCAVLANFSSCLIPN